MTRFGRVPRRPDHWSSPHERARLRAAERLGGPLDPAESAWLDDHLAECPACATIAAAYEQDRLSLRALRNDDPQPPRDLWARTAAAIEAESVARGRTTSHPGAARRRRLPLGALSGIAVILLVVGVSALSGGLVGITGPIEHGTLGGEDVSGSADLSSGFAPSGPPPTPFAVDAGNVAYVRGGSQGSVYRSATIREVCPAGGGPECAPIEEPAPKKVAMMAAPRTIISSPSSGRAVAVGRDTAGGDQVVVVDLPADTATPSQTGTPTPAPSVGASAPATTGPATSSEPSASADTNEPTPTPTSSARASVAASPSVSASISPSPTIAAGLAIASGMTVVGDSAAFSPDGDWFAFTARPVGGGRGPDVYVWRVGESSARPLTRGGASVFASWAGDRVVVSRPAAAVIDGQATATSVVLDPSTGSVTGEAGAVWRPVVDPARHRAVAWAGSIVPDGDATGWIPSAGRLELRSWPTVDGEGPVADSQVVYDGDLADYDVRWDQSGEWFGLWVADEAGAQVGRLSLFHVDPATGTLSRPKDAPKGESAMAGFSIGEGRLAWATPPGKDGEGSRIQVVAWRAGSVGSVETVPGEDLVVVR
jgi:hypothetical protein